MVTLVGQTILRGRIMVEEVTPEDWLHFTVATLCHDLGYLRGVCPGDRDGRYVIDAEGTTIEAPRGASDAFLAPYHIERGKIFVRHRCKLINYLDRERIAQAIELTRFPIPVGDDYAETATEPALVRAADLIGQLGDPNHSRKLNALYYEFRRERDGRPARLPIAGRSGRAVPASSSGPRSSPTSTRRLSISSGPWPASSGSPSSTPTCSSRSTSCRGRGRSGPAAAAERQARRRVALVSAGARRVCRTTQ